EPRRRPGPRGRRCRPVDPRRRLARPRTRRPARTARRRAVHAVRGAAADLRAARRRRAELSRSRRRPGHLDRHRDEPAVLRPPKAAGLLERPGDLMKSEWIDPDHGPTPEQLAAYADGELADVNRAVVEAWLSRDAAAAAEVESLRRFTQTWRDAAPSPPGPETW